MSPVPLLRRRGRFNAPVQFNKTCGRLNRLISFNRLPNYRAKARWEPKFKKKKKKMDCVVATSAHFGFERKHPPTRKTPNNCCCGKKCHLSFGCSENRKNYEIITLLDSYHFVYTEVAGSQGDGTKWQKTNRARHTNGTRWRSRLEQINVWIIKLIKYNSPI